MFYHTYILTKRGPFAKIWLAAHWDKKLSKNDVKVIDLSKVVLNIIEPVVPISLRTSGELMLGVVRVYGHKVRILLKESQDVAHELVRGREAHAAALSFSKGKNAVTNETISAVTFTDPIEKDMHSGREFDQEFATIEDLVMNNSSKPMGARKSLSDEQSIINKWFHTAAENAMGHNPPDAFLDFRNEINRDFFPHQDGTASISDRSKKSSSSGSSIEELRRSSVMPPSADKNRFHIDVGLPVEETDEFPEIPDLSMKTPYKLPLFMEEEQANIVVAEEFALPDHEPPRKKRSVLKQSLVDATETVIPSEVYRKHMHDRTDLLCPYYRQSSSDFPGEKPPAVDSTVMLGEKTPWHTFEKLFADELKAKTTAINRVDEPSELARHHETVPQDEEAFPEFAPQISPMQEFGQSDISDPQFTHETISWRSEAPEKSSAAFLEKLQHDANRKGNVVFNKSLGKATRDAAARRFGDLLALASRGDVTVKQEKPFADILVSV